MDSRSLAAYLSDWRDFESWCGKRGFQAMPSSPETVALYLRGRADDGLRPSTLRRRLAAITWQHRERRRPSPCSSTLVLAALRDVEQLSELAVDKRVPISLSNLRRLLAALPDTLNGTRDRAIISLSFAAALRRSELIRLNAEHVATAEDCLIATLSDGSPPIEIPRARTSPVCPVNAHEEWVATAGIVEGPLYRPVDRHGRVLERRLTDRSVGLIVTRAAERAGLTPAVISADSLRLGGAAFAALGLGFDDVAAAE